MKETQAPKAELPTAEIPPSGSTESAGNEPRNPRKFGIGVSTLALVTVLTLLTWMFFYSKVPLDAAGTAVVAGVWLGIVVAGRWMIGKWRTKSRGKDP